MYWFRGAGADWDNAGQNRALSAWHEAVMRRSAPGPGTSDWARA